MQISVTIDKASLNQASKLLAQVGGSMPNVMRRTIQRVVRAGRTDISSAVRKEIEMKKKDVDPHITTKVHGGGTTNQSGTITISRRGVPLIKFLRGSSSPSVHRRRPGVTVKVRKSEGSKVIRGTFLAKGRAGRLLILNRKARGAGSRVPRYPLEPRLGPSVHGVFANNPLGERAVRDLRAMFRQRLDHETRFEIKRAAERNRAKP